VGPGAITVGARPAHPANALVVQYRVDGGPIGSVRANPVAPPSGLPQQYFRASLPRLAEGGRVELLPVLMCGGRQVPAPGQAGGSSGFWYQAPPAPVPRPVPATAAVTAGGPRFEHELEFLGTITASLLHPPETVGATPQGIRKNFFLLGGTCRGPKLNAIIRPSGGDWLLIQRDGVGLPSVRTTWETSDGAVLYADYYGVFDLGESGYENALQDKFPDRASVQLAPRFATDHPRYVWLNRLQCLGIGQVDLIKSVIAYDLYACRGGLSLRKEAAR
jgi:hypothetical protein